MKTKSNFNLAALASQTLKVCEVFLFLGFLNLVAGSPASASPTRSEIEVQVFEETADSIRPLKAVVETVGFSESTDESGFLRFSVPVGESLIVVKVEGVNSGNDGVLVLAEEGRVSSVSMVVRKDRGTKTTEYIVEKPIERRSKETLVGSHADSSSEIQHYALRVLDLDGRPLERARVYLSDRDDRIETNKDGRLQLDARPGTNLTVSFPGFESQEVTVLSENALTIKLTPNQDELETLRVLAPRVKGGLSSAMETKRKSRGVSEVLAAEQMSKSGDGDAASSLRRVTGLTLVGGKYVYVRGLGERYSSILLNDAMISSPEPARRVVPLDLFPTNVLESIVVEKSYAADLPGEFGGGTIRIRTKSLPDKAYARIAIGVGNGSDSELIYKGGSLDSLGIDDGTRGLPGVVRDATQGGRRLKESNPLFPDGFSPTQLANMGRSFQNTWTPQMASGAATPSFQFAIGDRWKVSDALALGAQTSALYGTDSDFVEKESHRYSLGAGGRLAADSSKLETDSAREVRTALTGDLGGVLKTSMGEQSLSLALMLLRHTENSADIESESNANGRYRSQEISWSERELMIRQARWDGQFSNWKVMLRGSMSDAERLAPDRRSSRYIEEEDRYVFSTRADGNQRSFSELQDKNEELGFQVRRLGEASLIGKWEVTAEFLTSQRRRESGLRRFHFRDVRTAGSGVDLTKPVEEILSPRNIHSEGFQILETTRETDNYSADQTVRAKSIALDLRPLERVRLNVGVREEESTQNVLTYNLFDPANKPVLAGLWARDLLPSMVVSVDVAENHIVRVGYAETVSRPDFKELSTSPYTDEETGEEVIGNNNLRGAILRHFDIRYESYPSSDETVSLALFQKRFDHPIEQVIRPGSDGTIRSFDNAKAADNYGVEIEGRFRLRRWSNLLRHFNFAANVSLVHSQIELRDDSAGVQTSNQRPLQGQSPWATNMQMYYERSAWRFTGGLVLNVVGPRIRDAAAGGLPDIYEQPVPQLDAVFSKGFDDVFPLRIGLRIKNLLDPEVRLTQGGEVALRYKRGMSFNMNLAAVF